MSPFSGPIVLRTIAGVTIAEARGIESDEGAQPVILRCKETDHSREGKLWAPCSLVARLAQVVIDGHPALFTVEAPLVLSYEGQSLHTSGAQMRKILTSVHDLDSTFGVLENAPAPDGNRR